MALPSLTINNMTIGEVGRAVKHESTVLKLGKLSAGLISGAVAIFCCSYFSARFHNVNGMQDYCDKLLPEDQVVYCSNSTIYDFDFRDGPFEDDVAATEYFRLLGNCDAECWTIGNRWSTIYMLGAAAMGMFLVQAVLVSCGVYLYPVRLIALFFQSVFCLFNFVAVIVMAVFRFNTIGKLAALSQTGSTYQVEDDLPTRTEDRTYVDDGTLILRLWVISLIFVIAQCCLACYAVAPPT